MLPYLRKPIVTPKRKKPFSSLIPISPGIGIGDPASLPNLTNWFKAVDILGGAPVDSCIATWEDSQNIPSRIAGTIGDCTPPPTPADTVITINGHKAIYTPNPVLKTLGYSYKVCTVPKR